MSSLINFFGARWRAIVIFAVLIFGVYGFVAYNRATQQRLETALASDQQATRDAAVLNLVQSGRLSDVLQNTKNPDEEADSLQNQRSKDIRTQAAESVNRLTAAGKVPDTQALDTMFALTKDADVKSTAETGLAALGSKNDSNLKAIVSRLSNGDPDIRGAVTDVLGQVGGEKTAQQVNAALVDPASQDAAISALQKIGAPSVPLVVAHLQDPKAATDIQFRQQMVGLLDQIASPLGIPELTQLSQKPDQASVQRQAQVALANTVLAVYNTVQAAQDTLAKAQDDLKAAKDVKARTDAQKAITDAQTALTKAQTDLPKVRGAEQTLSAVLKNPAADGDARAQAALALGRFASPESILALTAALGDIDSRVRDAAQSGAQSAGPPAVGPLNAALVSGTAEARAAAAQALGGIGTPAAVASLNAALANPTTPASVRQSAVVGLGRSGNPAVIPTLVRALGDHDGVVQSAAQDGLLTPALAQTAIPLLVAAFDQPTPVPFNASQTLSRMGSLSETAVVPALTQAVGPGSASTRTWAAVTLGEIGSSKPSVLSTLKMLAQSSDPHVQYAASQSLTKLTGA